MKKQYEEIIWYYPYIKNDIGNKNHMEILIWLRENFNNEWDIEWIKSDGDISLYKPENLYIFFKTSEIAMAFKLRWL